MDRNSKIYIAGHKGLVGSAIMRNLQSQGYNNVVVRTHSELDLTNQAIVESFFQQERPEFVFLAAAKVGGIGANSTYPADFTLVNLQIECNVIQSAFMNKAKKLLFLGSACIYPRVCPQPIKEEYLLTGELEPSNEGYALAKISGLKMCQYFNQQYGSKFISVMPANLYGPNDYYDLNNSHVIPAFIRKMHEAKMNNQEFVEVWGTGTPTRDFLFIDDMADACIYLMNNYEGSEFFNIGTGKEISIKDLAELVKRVVGYKGKIKFDSTKPDGTPRRLLDVNRLSTFGWTYNLELEKGIALTYKDYLKAETRRDS
jgi:GDP-L-fucose synthase